MNLLNFYILSSNKQDVTKTSHPKKMKQIAKNFTNKSQSFEIIQSFPILKSLNMILKIIILIVIIIALQQMSSFYANYVVRLGKSAVSWSHRFVKFVKHRMLTQRKNVLIIGDHESPIYLKLHPLIAKNWEIFHISQQQPPIQQLAIQVEKPIDQNVKLQTTTKEKNEIEKKQEPTPKKSKQFFKRIYLHNQNYNEIQRQLQGKQFDSIIVLPNIDAKVRKFQISNEDFAFEYPTLHEKLLMRNVFAYRLASKCLTSSGVIIMSISERDFIKQYQVAKKEDNVSENQGRKYWISNELIDGQVNYLGVVIGDRDHTDLNSWSIIALSKEFSEEDPDFVAKYYKLWADSQQLPMPGTFALFKRKSGQAKTHYVQYL